MNEKRIEEIMKRFDCTREEAISVIEDDKAIDKGAKLFELDPELEKGAKKARQTTTAKKPTERKKVERKPNEDKREIVEVLRSALDECGATEISVENIEREIVFHFNEVKYKVVLSAPRK